MQRIVVIGGSVGGTSLVRSLRKMGNTDELVVVDPDLRVPYRRPGASKGVVAGVARDDDLAMPWDDGWDCTRLLGSRCVGVDPARQVVDVVDGEGSVELAYDKLVIASGAEASRPRSVPGIDRAFTIRTLADGSAIASAALGNRHAVVVGGGFLGLEVAASLRHRGLDVTVLEAGAQVLGGRFGSVLSEAIGDLHRRHGVDLRLETTVRAINPGAGEGAIAGVELGDGTQLESGIVVWATGATPAISWLGDVLGDARNGIDCDAWGRVEAAQQIYAIGDVARWTHPRYGMRLRVEHWTNAIDQAQVVARIIAGGPSADAIDSLPYVWSDQYDYKFQMLGLPAVATGSQVLARDSGSTIVGYTIADRLVGVAGVGTRGAEIMGFRRRLLQESWAGADAVPALRAYHVVARTRPGHRQPEVW